MSCTYRTKRIHMADAKMTCVRQSSYKVGVYGAYNNQAPRQQIKMIDLMVDAGEFPSKSEAIRAAVRNLVDDRSDKLLNKIEKISALK